MSVLNLATLADGRKAVIIRTSDRIAFKGCRRKWSWSSHLKFNLGPKQLSSPLWFGSAIHYALEDYHGWNKFGKPSFAFKAYCQATAKNWKRQLPPDAADLYELGQAIMDYYTDQWLAAYGRKPDKTYWAPNPKTGILEPQVEVNFEIPVPITVSPVVEAHCKALGIDVILYRGTIDRVCIDDNEDLWVDEYKTAKVFQNTHYATDPQVTTYVWATSLIYPDKNVAGVIYHQFGKKFPEQPRLLATGKISTAQNLVSSYPLYRQALESLYGQVIKAPAANQEFLDRLAKSETEDRDRYIIRDRIHRNTQQSKSEAWKIALELEDMLNPELPLYPNPTRDCNRMCSFLTPCVNMDDGSDWEGLLKDGYASRSEDMDHYWRRKLPSPADLFLQQELGVEPDLHDIQVQSAETYQLAEIAAGEPAQSEYDEEYGAKGIANQLHHMDENGSFSMADVARGT